MRLTPSFAVCTRNRPTDLAFAPRRDRGVISSELQNAGMRLDDVNDATIAWAAMLAVLPGVSGKKCVAARSARQAAVIR